MLVLQRTLGESLIFTVPPSDRPQKIAVQVVSVRRGPFVRLGVTADKSISVWREEVQKRIDGENPCQPE